MCPEDRKTFERDASDRTTDADWIPDPHTIEQLFDASPVPMVITSLQRDCILAVNARVTEVLGVPREEMVGAPVTRFYAVESEREEVIASLRTTGLADDVTLHLRRPDGTFMWAIASRRRVVWNGEPAILSAFVDITRQTRAEQSLARSEQRLAAQSYAVTTLTERSAEGTIRFDDRIREILRVAAETLDAERASLWRFDESHEEIRCECLFSRSGAQYEKGARIPRAMWPPYFAALESERVIAAHDAHRDPRTIGFLDGYLVPHGIGSMLDVPLRQNHGTLGVLCTEHVGGPRTWTLDEQNFALSVANLIAVAVADEERRRALARLAESEARANLIVDTAHDAFIGIDARGHIVHWNAQAASTFGWTRAEAIGRNVAETIIPPGYRAAHTAGMQRFHATGEAPVVNRRLELSALHRSGREFPVELTITSPIQGESGVFFGAFLRDISARKQHENELRTAKEFAERSRDSLDRELASAGRMQQLLLPSSLPSHASMNCVAYYRTSRHAGGDYYDVLPAGDSRFALVVADVSGHGASAAIVMAMIRAVLHSDDSTCRAPNTPPAVLHHLNRHFRYLWDTAMYATSIVGMFDVERRTLQLASAGHPPPLLVRDGEVREFPVANGPLLFWAEIDDMPCLEEALVPGDRVVFYTDGITDRPAADDSRFDLPRVVDALTSASHLDLHGMLDHLVRELDRFAGETEPDDDQTLLAVEIR
jgi:PAS domain S-box-containing protein